MERKKGAISIKSVTLLELLIAIVLLSVIVLGLTSIDIFSRHHVVDADRRAKLQNEIYFLMEHMTRNVVGVPVVTGGNNSGGAIGNEIINGSDTVIDIATDSGNNDRKRLKIYVDADMDGVRDAEVGDPDEDEDHWIAYLFYDSSAGGGNENKFRFCARCKNKNCSVGGGACSSGWVTLAENIVDFIPVKPVNGSLELDNNYINVQITACFDPANAITAFACGTGDNPQITMNTSIKMPSVSVR